MDSMPASMPSLTEVAEEEDPAEIIAELQARIQELEVEQKMMQRELDGVAQEAQRTSNHLRYAVDLVTDWMKASVVLLGRAIRGLSGSR